jgi:hypothetical protein
LPPAKSRLISDNPNQIRLMAQSMAEPLIASESNLGERRAV